MKVKQTEYIIKDLQYVIRSAMEFDAVQLSEVRLQVDGETEYMDREKGEAYIDEGGFKEIIKVDTDQLRNLFLVAEVNGRIVGFSRCEGSSLKRSLHKVEFGVCVLKEFWGYGIGENLLKESLCWVDSSGIKKTTLSVLETNEKAIKLYKKYGFEIEGVLREDKRLSDGNYYNTLLMGRLSHLLSR